MILLLCTWLHFLLKIELGDTTFHTRKNLPRKFFKMIRVKIILQENPFKKNPFKKYP